MSSREEMVERYLPLARRLARRYARRGEPSEDLEQVASLALVKAIDRFDPDRGRRFEDYAVPTILGELRRYFRDCGWAIGVGRSDQERVLKVRQAVAVLAAELGRSPKPAEIAAASNLTVEEALEALEIATATRPVSLDEVLGAEPDAATSYDRVGSSDGGIGLVEARDEIARRLRLLRPQEREILYMRFFEDLTQSEIGERMGCSQMQVSRVTRIALERTRAAAA